MSRRSRLIVLAGSGVAAALFLIWVRAVLTPFFIAIAIAYLGYPFVRLLETKQVPRSWAILLMYVSFAVLFLLFIYALLPSLTRELDEIAAGLPERSERIERLIGDALGTLNRPDLPEVFQDVADGVLRRIEYLIGVFARRLADLVIGAVSRVFHLILALFLTFYLLRDWDVLKGVLVSWLPTGWRPDGLELVRRVDAVVGGFIRGQLLVSAFIGVAVALALSLLGVQYALFLGLLTGLADIIPYFGPIVSAVPAVSLAFIQSPATALWVFVLLVVIQQIEAGVISPKIVGDQVGLHPLSVIFAVLAGNEIMGVAGMLIAVPIAAALKVILGYFVERSLDS